MSNAIDDKVILSRNEYCDLQETIESLELQLNQAMGALGYPVPGHIPEGNLKCGLCTSKEKSIIKLEAQKDELIKVIHIMLNQKHN
jgi:hypothetical protein